MLLICPDPFPPFLLLLPVFGSPPLSPPPLPLPSCKPLHPGVKWEAVAWMEEKEKEWVDADRRNSEADSKHSENEWERETDDKCSEPGRPVAWSGWAMWGCPAVPQDAGRHLHKAAPVFPPPTLTWGSMWDRHSRLPVAAFSLSHPFDCHFIWTPQRDRAARLTPCSCYRCSMTLKSSRFSSLGPSRFSAGFQVLALSLLGPTEVSLWCAAVGQRRRGRGGAGRG